jgi:hypothetical protein
MVFPLCVHCVFRQLCVKYFSAYPKDTAAIHRYLWDSPLATAINNGVGNKSNA